MKKMTDTYGNPVAYRDATGFPLPRPVLTSATTSTRRSASDGGTSIEIVGPVGTVNSDDRIGAGHAVNRLSEKENETSVQ